MVIDDVWIEALKQRVCGIFFKGNAVLIPRNDVDGFLDWIEPRRALLGAEGFKYESGKRIPLTEGIIDYSYGDPSRSVELHRRVITAEPGWKKADFIEFVLAKPTQPN